MIFDRTLAMLLVTGAFACASAPANNGSGPRKEPNIITQAQIDAAGLGLTAYDVVKHLRPNLVTARGQTSFNNGQCDTSAVAEPHVTAACLRQAAAAYPHVYVDGVRYGDINTLKTLPSAQVGEIRFYPASEAQTVFGTGNPAGVIAVSTRR